jgi:AraC-like DNA-binding protein
MEQQNEQTSVLLELEIRLFTKSLQQLKQNLAYDSRLESLWAFLEANYSDSGLTLQAASRACGMSKGSLNGKLKPLLGLTFHELLTNYRIYRSIALILAKEHTFTEAAFMSGFEASSSYTRAFKRTFHAPPRTLLPRGITYRRRLQLVPDGQASSDWNIEGEPAICPSDKNDSLNPCNLPLKNICF